MICSTKGQSLARAMAAVSGMLIHLPWDGPVITNENRKLHLDRAILASFAPNALTCHFIDAKDVCRDQESLRL